MWINGSFWQDATGGGLVVWTEKSESGLCPVADFKEPIDS